MTIVQKKSTGKLFDAWKIDKNAYDRGQAPEWVNTLLEPDNFFKNNYNIHVIINEAIKFSQKAIPFEGNYLLVTLDNHGLVTKKLRVTAEDKEVFEGSDIYNAFKN